MVSPTIHLNGTSGSALYDMNVAAAQAMQHALVALGDAAPNARDYYPQGPGAFEAARREHEHRVERLRAVYHELMDLIEAISDAIAH